MAAAKKTAKKAEPKDESPEETADEQEQGVRENNPAGVHDALKGPRSADLNPAFHDPV